MKEEIIIIISIIMANNGENQWNQWIMKNVSK